MPLTLPATSCASSEPPLTPLRRWRCAQVKTRMQTSNALLGSSSTAAAKAILQQEGLGIFFRGLGIRLIYLLPGTTITVTTYDWLKAVLLEMEAKRRL